MQSKAKTDNTRNATSIWYAMGCKSNRRCRNQYHTNCMVVATNSCSFIANGQLALSIETYTNERLVRIREQKFQTILRMAHLVQSFISFAAVKQAFQTSSVEKRKTENM